MREDADVARVVAALNAPGMRYRSFNNPPVRVRPVAPPAPEPEEPAHALPPETAPLAAFEFAAPEDLTQVEDVALNAAAFLAAMASAAPPEPAPEPAMEAAPPEPAPEPAPEPEARPLFTWPELVSPAAASTGLLDLPPVTAAPAAAAMPSTLSMIRPGVPEPAPPRPLPPMPASTLMPAWPMEAAMSATLPGADFRLLNAISRDHDPLPATQPPAAGTTLNMLRGMLDQMPAETPFPVFTAPPPQAPLMPTQGHILPAAAVTVPLSDVMRLLSVGANPPINPFDAVRSALAAQPFR